LADAPPPQDGDLPATHPLADDPHATELKHAVHTRLNELTGPDPSNHERAVAAQLVDTFMTRTPTTAKQLADAIQRGDADTAKSRAHALKGSAANIGATVLANLSAEIETRTGTSHLPGPESARLLHEEVAVVLAVLTEVRAELETEPGT
jgi:HPt (histidine-containing phosphotransfer) domain-containing protein